MREAALIYTEDGTVLYTHAPNGRTAGSIPDDVSFWDMIWSLRYQLYGIAHSHPGGGIPSPSREDITTFAAVEQALGHRLVWPIVTSNCIVTVRWSDRLGIYMTVIIDHNPLWAHELRAISAQ